MADTRISRSAVASKVASLSERQTLSMIGPGENFIGEASWMLREAQLDTLDATVQSTIIRGNRR